MGLQLPNRAQWAHKRVRKWKQWFFSLSEIDPYTVVWYGPVGPRSTSLVCEWLLLSPVLYKCSADNRYRVLILAMAQKIGYNHPSHYFPSFIFFMPLLPQYFLNIRGMLTMFSLGLRTLNIQDHNFIISLGYHFREYTDVWVAKTMMARAWFRYSQIKVMKQTMQVTTRDKGSFQRHLLELLLVASCFSYWF